MDSLSQCIHLLCPLYFYNHYSHLMGILHSTRYIFSRVYKLVVVNVISLFPFFFLIFIFLNLFLPKAEFHKTSSQVKIMIPTMDENLNSTFGENETSSLISYLCGPLFPHPEVYLIQIFSIAYSRKHICF